MSILTVQRTTYPTATPGSLGTGICKLVSSPLAEVLVTLASTVSGLIDLVILRWDGVGAWFPVNPLPQQAVSLLDPGPSPIFEPTRRAIPSLGGRSRFTFRVESPGYYLIFAPSAAAADLTEVQVNELYPNSGAYSSGSAVRGIYYAAPVAADSVTVHAAVASNAANTFPGPFGAIETWGRNVRCVFAASYDGGDVTVVGTDQFGQVISETIVAAAGTTVSGVKIFRTVTGISKATVGATANTVSVGLGLKIGVPFQFTAGQEFLNGVGELATLDTTYYAFTPGTAANAARNYNFLGW